MNSDTLDWFLAACVLLALPFLTLKTRTWVYRIRLQRRFNKARQGQDDAEGFLARQGYKIVQRQAQADVRLVVDGVCTDAYVQADLVVERNRRRAVVEVKTGSRAPDPSYIPTRRQLLEYSVAYPDHDVLLLDMESQCCRLIEFPDVPRSTSGGSGLSIPVAFACGLMTAGLYFTLMSPRGSSIPAPPSAPAVAASLAPNRGVSRP